MTRLYFPPHFSLRALPILLITLFAHDAAWSQTKETTLPEVTVKSNQELADGPVDGYRATRSSTFTKIDLPVKEVPASVTIVPRQLIKDASILSLGELFHYVPGAVMHQGEGNRDQIVIRGTSSTADFYLNGVR